MSERSIEAIAERMTEARARTLALFDVVREEADLHASPGMGFRPILWHLAHIGAFEEYWLLQRTRGDEPLNERYCRIFDPIKTPREASKDLPRRAEMERYLADVRGRVLNYLKSLSRTHRAIVEQPLRTDALQETDAQTLLSGGYIFDLVLEHELQHQETLAYLLQMLAPSKKALSEYFEKTESIENGERNSGDALKENSKPSSSQYNASSSLPVVTILAGDVCIGARGDGFVYDNELPSHARSIPAFKIGARLVTNEEFAHFVDEGGYARSEFWSDEGWSRREAENWTQPLYWSREADGEKSSWRLQRMFGETELPADHPVSGVCWHEAGAYARFMKKRLPTEFEWERAANFNPSQDAKDEKQSNESDEKKAGELSLRSDASFEANYDFKFWDTTPVGSFSSNANDLLDISGNVWEWTASEFAPYPKFRAYPYEEYSATWFDGDHRVLRGGSWATNARVLRPTFRNFFRRHFRVAFAGIRLAEDA